MISHFLRSVSKSQARRIVSVLISIVLLSSSTLGQQPDVSIKSKPAEQTSNPTFDTLLAADSYVIYGEVRNLGQLLSTGGAGEIVDPIMKLAGPPATLKSIENFLKSNAETLATSRLLFAASPMRHDIPSTFVAIEFATPEEAAKFAPKLDKFL